MLNVLYFKLKSVNNKIFKIIQNYKNEYDRHLAVYRDILID